MKIPITQEHIDKAVANQKGPGYYVCSDCVVAVAFSDYFKRKMQIGYVYFHASDYSIKGKCLDDHGIILTFDSKQPVHPCEIEVRLEE